MDKLGGDEKKLSPEGNPGRPKGAVVELAGSIVYELVKSVTDAMMESRLDGKNQGAEYTYNSINQHCKFVLWKVRKIYQARCGGQGGVL